MQLTREIAVGWKEASVLNATIFYRWNKTDEERIFEINRSVV